MLKRSAFRSTWTPAPRARDLPPETVRLVRSERRGTYSGTTSGVAVDKECAVQHQGYMALVRCLPCARCGYRPPVGKNQFCHGDQGKGMGLKTDVRLGWSGCGPHDGLPGCHWLVGTSGTLSKQERREEEARLAAWTRAEIQRLGLWPRRLPLFEENQALAPMGRGLAAIKFRAT